MKKVAKRSVKKAPIAAAPVPPVAGSATATPKKEKKTAKKPKAKKAKKAAKRTGKKWASSKGMIYLCAIYCLIKN